MSEPTDAQPQAIAAEVPSEQIQEPSLSYEQASASLTMAQMVGTPAEVERLKAIVAQHEQPAPVENEDPTAQPAGATEEEQAPPASEQTETETPTEEPAGDTPQETAAEVKVSDRPRLTHLNDQDKALLNAVVLLTRSGMSLAEANAKVFGTQTAAPVAEVEGAAPESEAIPEPMPDVAEAETRVNELKARLREAGQADGLFNEEIAQLTTDLIEANATLRDAKRAQVETTARNATLAEAKAVVLSQVVQKWPEIGDRNSAHWKMSRAIAMEVQEPDHPDHAQSKSANFAAYCAEEAAKLLGKTPAGAAPVAASTAKPSASPAVKPPGPAIGSRTSTPPAPAVSQRDRLEQSRRETEEILTGVRVPVHTRRADGIVR